MDALTAMRTRKSVRKYTVEMVQDEDLQKILTAGMQAPSAGNVQPWEFVVITEKKVLVTIAEFSPYSHMAASAPMAILVCGDLSKEKHKGYWVQDCSAAMQNMHVAVHALGLGSVWTGIYPIKERVDCYKEHFKLPDEMIPFGLLIVGHCVEKNATAPELRYTEAKVHFNQW